MTISKTLLAAILGLVTISNPAMAETDLTKPNQVQQVQKAACLPAATKTMIGTRYASNPNSYNNFVFTVGSFACTNNSSINTNGATTTPTTYRKAMYALKKAYDTSAVPVVSGQTLFKPFAWKATGNCTAFQNANGYKMNITSSLVGSPTTVTVKLCRDITINGIGDTARMRAVILQTIAFYYAPTVQTLILQNRFGTVIN